MASDWQAADDAKRGRYLVVTDIDVFVFTRDEYTRQE